MASRINIEKLLISVSILLKIIEKEKKISFTEFKKLFHINTNKELYKILDIISNLLYDKLSGYLLIEKNLDKKKEQYIYFDIQNKKDHFIQIPLNYRDLDVLINILSDDLPLLEKMINVFPFMARGENTNTELIKETLKELCVHNQQVLFEDHKKKKEIYLYYKKPLSYNLQLKKIIPIALKQFKNFDYVLGYDIKDSKLKIYRLERILNTGKIIETMLKININQNDIDEIWNGFVKINEDIIQIKFAYHPFIEMNLRTQYDFQILKNEFYTIEEEKWKVGIINTAFPDSFLEKVIPFANLIYIIEPKELNRKIMEYFKKILNQL